MEIADLSRYEVQETLGKGGMGEVLLATDTRLNRKVAIKRMLGDATKSQTAVKRFLTEAQSIAALNHFNIVQIYDHGRDKDGPFLIMEYVGGGSLLDKCREGALPLEEAVELTCQLCDGLSQAHDAGIIHRDIKPANILLTNDGLPKLTDFGLAKDETADTGQTMAGAVLGTLDFMPPEQRRDATQTDARSDLWSLAATLYQLVTGESPNPIDLDDIPEKLRPVISKGLKRKPDARYQTTREFRDALLGCVRSAAPEVATPVANSPVSEVTVEPVAGECPKCHTKNEASRKFCSNGTCGGPLRVTCLACEIEIPVWDQVCGECGGNQKELLAAKIAEEKRLADEERIHEEERLAIEQRLAAAMREPLITNSIGMQFKLIPAGTFQMGKGQEAHTATLTQPFHLGVYAVTQDQYEKVTGANPSNFKSPQNPVEMVSWDDAVEFCRKLSDLPAEKSTGSVYQLPTEAEWEYACRAGTTTTYSFGDGESSLRDYAWYRSNSAYPQSGGFWSGLFKEASSYHHPVGEKKPNPWGLYDMHGNVWEWCQDWYGDYSSSSVTDPQGVKSGSLRVYRGGGWSSSSGICRSAIRGRITPDHRSGNLGFRVLRSSIK
jgi:formylglycine-generating enzyme required for sulfatase activity